MLLFEPRVCLSTKGPMNMGPVFFFSESVRLPAVSQRRMSGFPADQATEGNRLIVGSALYEYISGSWTAQDVDAGDIVYVDDEFAYYIYEADGLWCPLVRTCVPAELSANIDTVAGANEGSRHIFSAEALAWRKYIVSKRSGDPITDENSHAKTPLAPFAIVPTSEGTKMYVGGTFADFDSDLPQTTLDQDEGALESYFALAILPISEYEGATPTTPAGYPYLKTSTGAVALADTAYEVEVADLADGVIVWSNDTYGFLVLESGSWRAADFGSVSLVPTESQNAGPSVFFLWVRGNEKRTQYGNIIVDQDTTTDLPEQLLVNTIDADSASAVAAGVISASYWPSGSLGFGMTRSAPISITVDNSLTPEGVEGEIEAVLEAASMFEGGSLGSMPLGSSGLGSAAYEDSDTTDLLFIIADLYSPESEDYYSDIINFNSL